jgi:hypothetical protein
MKGFGRLCILMKSRQVSLDTFSFFSKNQIPYPHHGLQLALDSIFIQTSHHHQSPPPQNQSNQKPKCLSHPNIDLCQ